MFLVEKWIKPSPTPSAVRLTLLVNGTQTTTQCVSIYWNLPHWWSYRSSSPNRNALLNAPFVGLLQYANMEHYHKAKFVLLVPKQNLAFQHKGYLISSAGFQAGFEDRWRPSSEHGLQTRKQEPMGIFWFQKKISCVPRLRILQRINEIACGWQKPEDII